MNGENYIKEAIDKGARVIVCSNNSKIKAKNTLYNKKEKYQIFFKRSSLKIYKSKPKNIIAITGTNGKTSVADIFYQIFRINNIPAASIGTLGIKFKGKILKIILHLLIQFHFTKF